MPDPVDYLGAPKIITGTDYMHALAALGYNVENMSSPLPTMTKIAEAGTNFLDSIYNQNMKAQQSQADLQYSLAKTRSLNTDTDYNQQANQYRIDDLRIADEIKRATQDDVIAKSKISRDQELENLRHSQNSNPLLEEENRQKNVQAGILTDEMKSQQQRNQQAFDEWPMARADLDIPVDAPDFEQKLVDFYRNHPNVATSPNTKPMVDSLIKSMESARATLSSVQEANSNATLLRAQKATGDIAADTNIDALKTNPDLAHQTIVRGNVTGQQRRISEILAAIGPNPPPELRTQADDLRNAQNRLKTILGAPDGINQVANGAWSEFFDTNGRLNAGLEGDISAMQTYAQERVKQGLAKPMSTTVTVKGSDQLNPSEIRIENVPAGQEQEVTRQMQEALKTEEDRAKEKAGLQQNAQVKKTNDVANIIKNNPDIDRAYQEAVQSGDWSKVQDIITKLLPSTQQPKGMQDGGLVQASYTPGSESQMLPGTEPEIPRQVQNAARAEMLLRPGDPNAPYLGGGSLPGPSGRLLSPTDRINWHNFNFGATQSFSGGPGFYNNPGSGKPFDTGDPALVGARVPMAELTRVLGTDAGSEKSVTSRDVARGMYQVVVAKRDGTLAKFPIVDVTPEGKNRGLELTPAAMKMMDAKPGDNLGYRLAFPDAGNIDPTFGGESPIHNWLRQRDVGRRSRAPGGAIALQDGGLVSGAPGPDQVPAMLTSGEYVVPKEAVQDIGLPALEALTGRTAGTPQLSLSSGTQEDVQFQQPTQPSAFQSLFGQAPSQDSTPPIRTTPVVSNLPIIRPQLAQPTQAPRATPAQTPAPRAMPAQTPTVATGAATLPISSTGGTTLMPKYTTGDYALNAHYLGDGRLSGLATNFGHDVNGRPDTYMLSKLGGGSRIGAFGMDVVNPTTAAASVPVQTFRAFVGDPKDPQVRQRVTSGHVGVEVWAPNGNHRIFPIGDLGPGKGENASLDLTGTAMRELGMKDNFGAVYRIVSY
jgi:hypothetical protein